MRRIYFGCIAFLVHGQVFQLESADIDLGHVFSFNCTKQRHARGLAGGRAPHRNPAGVNRQKKDSGNATCPPILLTPSAICHFRPDASGMKPSVGYLNSAHGSQKR